jgi:hypothetical protein
VDVGELKRLAAWLLAEAQAAASFAQSHVRVFVPLRAPRLPKIDREAQSPNILTSLCKLGVYSYAFGIAAAFLGVLSFT